MRSISCPGARLLLAAALVAGLAPLLQAQQAPVPAPAPPVPAPTGPAPVQQAVPAGPVKPLSIQEAVDLALQQNLGIQIERLNPEVQDLNISQVLSNYTPQFGGSAFKQSNDQPPSSFLSGGQDKISTDSTGFTTSLSKFFKWGTDAAVSFDSSRQTTTNTFSSFNPSLGGNLDLMVTQPLLRNFKYDSIRQQLFGARKNREIADVDLRQTVAQTTRTVKNAYWDYVYAINALAVANQSLSLAQESLRNTRSRVEIGTLAPIDVVQAESEVASREEAVILAEAQIGQSEDNLRTLIFDPKTPQFWEMHLQPTDMAPFETQEIDVIAAVNRALNERTDLISARKRLEITSNSVKYLRNQTLPGVDLRLDYNTTGLGGTQLIREGEGFPPPVVGQFQRSYGNLLSDVFRSSFPTWRLGLNVSYPIGTSNAEASLARTRIEQSQTETSLRQLELSVAAQVRDGARQLLANSKRVEATKAARVLAERRLEAEEKKFAAGMSTSFEVFQAQRDLAQARSNELRAVLDYNQSQVNFETVQVAPTGGGGGSFSNTGGGTVTGGTTAGATTNGGGTQQQQQQQQQQQR